MAEEILRPAWSQQFTRDAIQELLAQGPFAHITPEWAWGGSTGSGIRVAVVDSGVEHDHPALGGCVRGGVIVEYDAKAENEFRIRRDEKPADVSGHGTACAGIIHSIAPQAKIYSVRVLGRDMRGKAIQFATGLDWAIDAGMQVINLSLSTTNADYFALFHQITDAIPIPTRTAGMGFSRMVLVTGFFRTFSATVHPTSLAFSVDVSIIFRALPTVAL